MKNKIMIVILFLILICSLVFSYMVVFKQEKQDVPIKNETLYDLNIKKKAVLNDIEVSNFSNQKKIILQKIDEVNVKLSKETDQKIIDVLADEKEKLLKEYSQVESGEING